jgi:hypothetical protein
VKGFDYGGKLPSHPKCNNGFGPEIYAAKALDLIAALHDSDCWFEYPHPKNPLFRMMALKSTCLPRFTRQDMAFFKIIDAKSKSKAEIHDLSLIEGREPVDPRRLALFTALAVLTKSAAALLVSRHVHSTPPSWKVLAVPYVADADAFDLDELFGPTVPFDLGVKVWLAHLETDDFLVAYRAKRVIVFFLFHLSQSPDAWNRMLSRFAGVTRLQFRGRTLRELVSYAWKDA